MEGLLSGNLLSKASVFGNSGGSSIKSIQEIDAIGNDGATQDFTIAPVDTTKSVIMVTFLSDATSSSGSYSKFELIDSTTVRRSSQSSFSISSKVIITVIEFNNVKSKQTGTQAFTSSLTATINVSSYNTSKSLLIFSLNSNSSSSTASDLIQACFLRGKKLSSTQIQFERYAYASTQLSVSWQLIEFN